MAGFVGIGTFEKRIGTSKSERELKLDRQKARGNRFVKEVDEFKDVAGKGASLLKSSLHASESPLGRKIFRGSTPRSALKKRII